LRTAWATSGRPFELEHDLSARGLGVRSRRYAMAVHDGVIEELKVDLPGGFEVSDAASMLAMLD